MLGNILYIIITLHTTIICLPQTNRGKIRQYHGSRFVWTFGEWQYNATNGHCTAITYFVLDWSTLLPCAPTNTMNHHPPHCLFLPHSTSSFLLSTSSCPHTQHDSIEPIHRSGFAATCFCHLLSVYNQYHRSDFFPTCLLLSVFLGVLVPFRHQMFIHRCF